MRADRWMISLLAMVAAARWAYADARPQFGPEDSDFVVRDGPAAVATAWPDGVTPSSLWFPVGEELMFTIHWSFIPVGSSHTWTEWVKHEDRTLLAICIRTRTNKVLSSMYPVDDYIESLIDPRTFLPVRFWKRLSEGRSRYDEVTYFNHEGGFATQINRIRGATNAFEIACDTRCIPSLLYALRKEKFVPGVDQRFHIMADDNLYDLTARVEKQEDVPLSRYGRVPTVKIEPVAQFGGVFVRKGRLWMWVTRDPRRIAARIVAEVPVATVQILLDEVRGPGGDSWVKGSGTKDDRKGEHASH